MGSDWDEQRRRAIAVHVTEQRRRATAEAGRAGRMIAEFATNALSRNIPPVALTARAYNGRGRYRTGLRGWYLKPDLSLAVSVDGAFYIMATPAGLRARLTGAELTPATPTLIVGVGARDGESLPLATLLSMRLDAGTDWP